MKRKSDSAPSCRKIRLALHAEKGTTISWNEKSWIMVDFLKSKIFT
jgi:hypothetical protein